MAKSLNISSYIKERLQAITPELAIPFRVLVKDLVERFPTIKDTTSASVRINSVLKQKTIKNVFERIKGKDNKVYISLKPPTGAVDETEVEDLSQLKE